MRAGLYARVSTHDQQAHCLQIEAMTAHLEDRVGGASSRLDGPSPSETRA
jgi:hypothetical protein